MLLKAPAKLNLTLRILSKRADGYHEISSRMKAICLYDEVDIVVSDDPVIVSEAKQSRIQIKTNSPFLPDGPENLAWQAAALAMKELTVGSRNIRIKINIKKNIPIGAGLGGGSADAAAVILGIANTLSPETDISELAAIGAKIGADIPFCVYSCAAANPIGYEGFGSAVAGGIGERLDPDQADGKGRVVLVKPDISVNTNEAYALYDATKSSKLSDSENDLESPCAASRPLVAEIITRLKKLCEEEGAGEAKVQLSGSGPTVFVYFSEDRFGGSADKLAEDIYEKAKAIYKDYFVYLTGTL